MRSRGARRAAARRHSVRRSHRIESTRAGIAYPEDLLLPLSAPAALRLRAHPLGLSARAEAVAADCAAAARASTRARSCCRRAPARCTRGCSSSCAMLGRACWCPVPVIRCSSTSRGSRASCRVLPPRVPRPVGDRPRQPCGGAPLDARRVAGLANNPTGSYVTRERDRGRHPAVPRSWLGADRGRRCSPITRSTRPAPVTDLRGGRRGARLLDGRCVEVARPAAGEARMGRSSAALRTIASAALEGSS
jgi:hypothetical protein